MRCQQRAKRRCPRCSSDVLEADPAPPAGAPICSRRARGEPQSRSVEVRAIRGSSSTAPAPDQEGVLLCARAQKKGSSWPSGSELFDTIQIGLRINFEVQHRLDS